MGNAKKFLIGKKVSMTQVFDDAGRLTPVTVLSVGPCVVTHVKTNDHDGFDAVELGWGFTKKMTKALQGHLKGLGSFRTLRQFRVASADASQFERGKTVDVSWFESGEKVTVVGTSKGHGFQGVVKRHKFHGHPASHGHKDQQRMPGSSGPGGLQRVAKGKRMSGHMGDERVTVKNLKVVKVDPQLHELWVRGAVPGARGTIVTVTV